MTRRRMICLFAGLLLVAALGVLESQRILTGWMRGEAFYRGRPTSYWRKEMTYWRPYFDGWRRDYRREPLMWEKPLNDWFGLKPREEVGGPFRDLGCIDVIRELAKDPGGPKGPAKNMWAQIQHAFPDMD